MNWPTMIGTLFGGGVMGVLGTQMFGWLKFRKRADQAAVDRLWDRMDKEREAAEKRAEAQRVATEAKLHEFSERIGGLTEKVAHLEGENRRYIVAIADKDKVIERIRGERDYFREGYERLFAEKQNIPPTRKKTSKRSERPVSPIDPQVTPTSHSPKP